MLTGIRKIERFSLRCPILLSPLSDSLSTPLLLSLTKNISAQGAYVFGRSHWADNSPLFASLFYELSLLSKQEADFRFLIRFRARAVRREKNGFALEFSRKNRIVPIAKKSALTPYELKAAEMIEYVFPAGET